MVDTVSTVISSASPLRGNTGASATARPSIDTSGSSSSIEPVRAPFISPVISVDLNFDKAVLQVRDSDTGDVLSQFPSNQVLQARQRQAQRVERAASERLGDEIVAQQRQAELSQGSELQQLQAPQQSNLVSDVQAAPPAAPVVSQPQAQVASAALIVAAQSGQPSTSVSVQV